MFKILFFLPYTLSLEKVHKRYLRDQHDQRLNVCLRLLNA